MNEKWGVFLVIVVVIALFGLMGWVAVDQNRSRTNACRSAFSHAKTAADTLNVIRANGNCSPLIQ